MAGFLRNIVPDLAMNVVASSLAGYVLHRINPSPSGTCIVVLCVVNACVGPIIRTLSLEKARSLSKENGCIDDKGNLTNGKFHQLNTCFMVIMAVFMPIFYRSIGQGMGCQVPSYVQTVGYLSFTGNVGWIAKSSVNFITLSYCGKQVFH
jgi:hypothetical protein